MLVAEQALMEITVLPWSADMPGTALTATGMRLSVMVLLPSCPSLF